jgi:hypothetical protein
MGIFFMAGYRPPDKIKVSGRGDLDQLHPAAAATRLAETNSPLPYHRIRVPVLNAPLSYLVLAVDALSVDLAQYGDAVPGPLGDLGRQDTAVELAGDAGMAQVVYAPGERQTGSLPT